jgi:hypothetical protein
MMIDMKRKKPYLALGSEKQLGTTVSSLWGKIIGVALPKQK